MNIEDIKEKLARVGLPLHGTDEELKQRAEANGLIFNVKMVFDEKQIDEEGKLLEARLTPVVTVPTTAELEETKEELEQRARDTGNGHLVGDRWTDEEVETMGEQKPLEVNRIEPKRGRPKKK